MTPSLAYRSLESSWPYPVTQDRKPPTFRATWAATKSLLLSEAEQLGAALVVVQFDVTPGAIRRDGELRADARVGDFPGVIVSFGSRHGPLTYATDKYQRQRTGPRMKDWQANVRAIALSLEALRSVDRHGVTRAGEQYRGWQEIEPPRPNGSSFATVDAAARWLVTQYGGSPDGDRKILRDAEFRRTVLRAVAMRVHPDRGGARTDWDRYEHARQLLETAS